jgi:tetratricopeptide (TPR) repeat protein
MLSFVVAILAGLLTGTLFHFGFPQSVASMIIPGLVAFGGAAVLLLRWSGSKVEPMLKAAEKHITGGRRELALKTIRDGMALGKWNPFLPGQLRVQVGVLEYAAGNFDAAEAELSKASKYPWLSRAYLGCVYFKKREPEKMKKAFDDAVKVGEKEGVLYTLYAYCLNAQGQKDEAVAVLEKSLKKIEGKTEAEKTDRGRIENNIELLKEGKKLKTQVYGDAWNRFALEGPAQPQSPQQLPKFMRGYNPRPGFRQRPQRRK